MISISSKWTVCYPCQIHFSMEEEFAMWPGRHTVINNHIDNEISGTQLLSKAEVLPRPTSSCSILTHAPSVFLTVGTCMWISLRWSNVITVVVRSKRNSVIPLQSRDGFLPFQGIDCLYPSWRTFLGRSSVPAILEVHTFKSIKLPFDIIDEWARISSQLVLLIEDFFLEIRLEITRTGSDPRSRISQGWPLSIFYFFTIGNLFFPLKIFYYRFCARYPRPNLSGLCTIPFNLR